MLKCVGLAGIEMKESCSGPKLYEPEVKPYYWMNNFADTQQFFEIDEELLKKYYNT
jgi:hypothetical protein